MIAPQRDASREREEQLARAVSEYRDDWLAGRRPEPEQFCNGVEEGLRTELRSRIDAFLYVADGLRTPDDSAAPPAAPEALGDFEIIREIGRGGMGVVYEARQRSLERRVALKLLPATLRLYPKALERFQREALTASKLQHPCIVQVYTVGEADGVDYFSMEFVDGEPLDKVVTALATGQPAQPLRELTAADLRSSSARSYIEAVCDLVARVADALDAAHESGVVHRDVKPGNILLRPDGSPVLLDFGLARNEELPGLTVTGEFAGTPHYMSPEQAGEQLGAVGHRTDIYSAGVTLYELLTLQRPFDGQTSHDLIRHILTREPTPPRRHNPLVPRDLETICLVAMDKDPERRYTSAGALAADLRRFLAFEPIAARPASTLRRVTRWVQRNRARTLVFLLLALLVAGAPYLYSTLATLDETEDSLREEQDKSEHLTFGVQISELRDRDPGLRYRLSAHAWDGVTSDPAIYRALYESWLATFAPGRLVEEWQPSAGASFVASHPNTSVLFVARTDGSWSLCSIDGTSLFEGPKSSKALAAAFSGDGSFLATATDGTVSVWEVRDGSRVVHVDDVHACSRVPANRAKQGLLVSFDSNGQRVACVGRERRGFVIYDVATRTTQRLAMSLPVNSVAFAPNGKFVAIACEDGTARVWDLSRNEEACAPLKLNAPHAVRAQFHRDGERLVTLGTDDRALLWQWRDAMQRAGLGNRLAQIKSFSILPSGRVLFLGSDLVQKLELEQWARQTEVTLFATRTGGRATLRRAFSDPLELRGHEEGVAQVVSSVDEDTVTTLSDGGVIRVWSLLAGDYPFEQRITTDGVVAAACKDPTGPVWTLAAEPAAEPQSARVNAWPDGQKLFELPGGDATSTLHVQPDQQQLLASRREVVLYDLAADTERLRTPGTACAYSPDGHNFAIGTADGGVTLWSSQKVEKISVLGQIAGACSRVDFDSRGARVVVTGELPTARIFTTQTTRAAKPVDLNGHWLAIAGAAFSPDNDRHVVTWSWDHTARIWDAGTGRLLHVLPHGEAVKFAAFDPSGRRIVTASRDRTAAVWSAATGAREFVLQGHFGDVNQAAFSADGQFIATAGRDHNAILWRASDGERLATLRGHSDSVLTIAFDDPGWFVTTSADGTLRRWPLDPMRDGDARDRVPGKLTELEQLHVTGDGEQGAGDPDAERWEDPVWLRQGCDATLRLPSADPTLYELARQRAARLVELEPNANHRTLHGLALYRCQRYSAAIEQLKALRASLPPRQVLIDVALALAHFRRHTADDSQPTDLAAAAALLDPYGPELFQDAGTQTFFPALSDYKRATND